MNLTAAGHGEHGTDKRDEGESAETNRDSTECRLWAWRLHDCWQDTALEVSAQVKQRQVWKAVGHVR